MKKYYSPYIKQRKQCKSCLKTFIKPGRQVTLFASENVEYDICPYCGGNFIIV